jgi:hypothetical protein
MSENLQYPIGKFKRPETHRTCLFCDDGSELTDVWFTLGKP